VPSGDHLEPELVVLPDAARRAIAASRRKSIVITNRNSEDAYVEATDGCRYVIPPTSQIVRQSQRVKADEETPPLAELDYEKEPIRWRAAVAGY
jgi:hypothetical protein